MAHPQSQYNFTEKDVRELNKESVERICNSHERIVDYCKMYDRQASRFHYNQSAFHDVLSHEQITGNRSKLFDKYIGHNLSKDEYNGDGRYAIYNKYYQSYISDYDETESLQYIKRKINRCDVVGSEVAVMNGRVDCGRSYLYLLFMTQSYITRLSQYYPNIIDELSNDFYFYFDDVIYYLFIAEVNGKMGECMIVNCLQKMGYDVYLCSGVLDTKYHCDIIAYKNGVIEKMIQCKSVHFLSYKLSIDHKSDLNEMEQLYNVNYNPLISTIADSSMFRNFRFNDNNRYSKCLQYAFYYNDKSTNEVKLVTSKNSDGTTKGFFLFDDIFSMDSSVGSKSYQSKYYFDHNEKVLKKSL